MARIVWESVEVCDPERRAPLVNQWRALSAEIAELEKAEAPADRGTPLDELRKRRDARKSTASG